MLKMKIEKAFLFVYSKIGKKKHRWVF